ncbi:hypothetical protein [Clostridium lacusfryxellense]|uniref:hypothetical protein n=1 Tax=Clostridium lacusfryxellense TaxID=205328 RepID=UPI001C0D28F3|nr:hypothetical protein [Clostridium lacusfryxellense]MBU3113694.1 hypothetical protein [Clostridium lacusfryxellense]
MKKRHYFILMIAIITLILTMNNLNIIKKDRLYYTGKIESINQKHGTTTVEVSPVSSNRYFITEIKANHQIEYKLDSITVSGLSDPIKDFKRVKMGELGELVTKFKVGDTIIFKVVNKDYDKNEHNLKINELAVDRTLE